MANNLLLGQNMLLPLLVKVNKEGEMWIIDKVLDSKIDRRINNLVIKK